MRRLYQKEWFGIPFSSFSGMSRRHMAGKDFYDKFYDKFYEKYSSYDELPAGWKKQKKMIADHLLDNSDRNMTILSVGCGIGYIEHILRSHDRDVVVVEPSSKATAFLNKGKGIKICHGLFPECLPDEPQRFDLMYLVDTDYVFDQRELTDLMKSAKKHCRTIIFVSILRKNLFLETIEDALIRILSFLRLREMGQFWGYLRTADEFMNCLKKAGYTDLESGILGDASYWVRGRP